VNSGDPLGGTGKLHIKLPGILSVIVDSVEDGDLVPLSGQEIGQLMAQALEGGAIEKSPWYEPSDSVPEEPIVGPAPQFEFDSLVVDSPIARANEPTVLRPRGTREKKVEPQRCQAYLEIRLRPLDVTIAASRSAFE
jgi:hypothetical protein